MAARQETRELRARNEARCRRLLDRSELLDTSDLDWDRVGEVPLDDGTLHTLVYMRDVEHFTDRDFAGMSAHPTTWSDPLLVAFFSTWRAEEGAHARALGRYLEHYAARRQVVLPALPTPPPAEASWVERALVRASQPVGHVVAATHMAWGATNELLTMNGYRLLRARTADPVLHTLLGRIAAQEARHYGFYLLQTEWRLAASGLSRRLVRLLLERTWTPVGVGADFKPAEDFARVAAHLTADEAGRRAALRMDRVLENLPGLDGVALYARALAAAA